MVVTSRNIRMVVWVYFIPFLLGTLTSKALSARVDFSPNCNELLKSYPVCNDIILRYACLKTCAYNKEFPLTCGIRHVASYIAGHPVTNDEGTSSKADEKAKRIVGGTESKEGAWPWQVALMFKGKQYCSGALISPSWVATAAHCFGTVTSKLESDWSIVLGEHKLASTDKFEQHRSVKKIIIHPDNFRYWELGYLDIPDDYDIALIKLSSPASLSDYVNTICLPDDLVSFPSGTKCRVAGWGKTKWNGSQPDALREAAVQLVPRAVCNAPSSYNGKIHQRAVCAGYENGGVDACQYDSGGGLACENDGRFYLEGLVSWGIGCARPHKYGVYTNVGLLKNWLVQTIVNEEPMMSLMSNRVYKIIKSLFRGNNSVSDEM